MFYFKLLIVDINHFLSVIKSVYQAGNRIIIQFSPLPGGVDEKLRWFKMPTAKQGVPVGYKSRQADFQPYCLSCFIFWKPVEVILIITSLCCIECIITCERIYLYLLFCFCPD